MPHRPDNPEQDAQWRTAGDRIQNLLDASAAGGAVARERAEQLVREVTDLYGAGLRTDDGHGGRGARPSSRTRSSPTTSSPACCWCTGCIRTASSGGSRTRWTACGPTSGRTAATSICSRSTARWSGCSSPAAARAVRRRRSPSSWPSRMRCALPRRRSRRSKWWPRNTDAKPAMIPADSLMSRVRTQPQGHAWHPVPDVAELAPGEVGGFAVAGTDRAGLPARRPAVRVPRPLRCVR